MRKVQETLKAKGLVLLTQSIILVAGHQETNTFHLMVEGKTSVLLKPTTAKCPVVALAISILQHIHTDDPTNGDLSLYISYSDSAHNKIRGVSFQLNRSISILHSPDVRGVVTDLAECT
jgi:hypothetical protein